MSLPDLPKGFDNEAGGHRIQRIPHNEKRGRVHTSTVTVSVIRGPKKEIIFNDDDFNYRFYSGTGKGGQKRNKVMSCVTVTHIPTGLTQNANGRSRIDNVEEALRILKERLTDMNNISSSSSINDTRQSQIGSGMRGDKVRTYRFRDDSITDHKTGKSTSAKKFMRGDIEKLW